MSDFFPKILVVDDEPNNLRVYERILAPLKLDIIKAHSGQQALAIAHKHDFFLILMDVQMPGMDGFETASLILDHPKTSHIPVIFITAFARDETFEFKGYMNGAVDYLVKPINDEILKSKLGVFLELYKERIKLDKAFKIKEKAEEELKVHKENLEETVKARTKELQESIEHLLATQDKLVKVEKMASLGRLVTGVAHELNTPIGICVTAASFIEEETIRIHKSLIDQTLDSCDLSAFCESSIQGSEMLLSNLSRATNLIKKFKLIAVDVSTEELSTLNLMSHIDEIIIQTLPSLDLTHHQITIEGDKELTVVTYPETLKQVLKELMLNSITHAFESEVDGRIAIDIKRVEDKVRLCFRDNGRGIEAETLGMVFEPFFTTSRGTGASGLGLYIVFNLATHVLKGEVSCSSQVGEGTEVIITFPLEHRY
ncbi:hybrid sensor histidine kinase/response regulator [Shewanella sp. D64]|uniref:hybrid sensor histidine kinase/response regulator n=1 Tax=unclassified Shewanella TaxID=196818 RepID=UPI0022BA5566|nr:MULTISPECIES: hybrid sensor histidine kinase/response regulator [unclassified Shewanella]MEC4724821.1 hybrid sensor histidine kinase/response regulator [Shewanella sp. D64]MEC4736385.1 hybrid sensor histidine kinase/response regulator [Shewanella sp. E94]WBJ97556.1 hybrid sensor histidine kinase/response regulator [Shewanella sp. MTB7]